MDPASKAAIGQRLRALRLALGVTQGEMARLAGYAAANGWSQVEGGVNKIPLSHAQKLTRHVPVDLNWIYEGNEGQIGKDLARKICQILDDLHKAKQERPLSVTR